MGGDPHLTGDWLARLAIVAAALAPAPAPGDVMGSDTATPPGERGPARASAARASRIVRLAEADAAIALVRKTGLYVVTFTGFSDAGYEDRGAVEGAIAKVLDEFEPTSAAICAGATPEGIGVVYPMAKQRGFTTIGIVSAVAEKEGASFSSSADTVYVIADDTWGGLGAGGELSPTSSAMVGSADEVIAIGGGEISRDEVLAARARGKKVRYIAADMNHAGAIRKAREKRQPEPRDFRGALAPHFDAR